MRWKMPCKSMKKKDILLYSSALMVRTQEKEKVARLVGGSAHSLRLRSDLLSGGKISLVLIFEQFFSSYKESVARRVESCKFLIVRQNRKLVGCSSRANF